MARQGQGGIIWSEVLCCPVCSHLFAATPHDRNPINLACGHSLCRSCIIQSSSQCPIDQIQITIASSHLPVNQPLLSVLLFDANDHATSSSNESILRQSLNDDDLCRFINAEHQLTRMATYLRRAESERGGSVWSEDLSRPLQRKLVSLICFQLLESDGRLRAIKTARALGERILTELLLCHQNSAHLSSNLWSAVRARGCQFLGPAMQEEVLRLILLTLSEGASIARKTLVMYIVQTLSEDYPQVSKTCVGHVVQLLYRASCFNVIKRDGESSLMQLKQEYRDYESLRREHDAQIVAIAIEAGLRISPDQWSSLLYGDQTHRSHMQSIIDKLQSPQAFVQNIQELVIAVQRNGDQDELLNMIGDFEVLASIDPMQTNDEAPTWDRLDDVFRATSDLLDAHVRFTQRRNHQRQSSTIVCNRRNQQLDSSSSAAAPSSFRSSLPNYKTRLCRDVAAGRLCPRAQRCTYAHSDDEMRFAQQQQPTLMQPVRLGASAIDMSRMPPPSLQQQIFTTAMPNTGTNDGSILVDTGGMMVPLMPTNMVMVATQQTDYSPTGQSTGFVQQQPTSFLVQLPPTIIPSQPPTMFAALPSMDRPPPVPLIAAPLPGSLTFIPHSPQGSADQLMAAAMCPPVGSYWIYGNDGNSYANQLGVAYEPPSANPTNYIINAPEMCTDARGSGELAEEEQLKLRRDEIIRRLAAMQKPHEDCVGGDDDDANTHVSHVCANSVLSEAEKEALHNLELPPLPLQYNSVAIASIDHFSSQFQGELCRPINRISDINSTTTTVRTVCPITYSDLTPPATVQSPCVIMQVKGTINQPVATPALQRQQPVPSTIASGCCCRSDMVDLSEIADRLPTVIRSMPIQSSDPQNVVSSTLDRIVDVQERLSEAEKNGPPSGVEQQQLHVELNIVSRQIQSLDRETKQSCLLKELEAVDRKIEEMNIGSVSDAC